MTTLVALAMLVALCLMLLLGLLSVLRELMENTHHEPLFRDDGEEELKSQFAWQSRSHSRAGD